MIRRFVNLMVDKRSKVGSVFSLHRLDVDKHLFFPSRADARAVPLVEDTHDPSNEPEELQVLPPPCVKILPSFRIGELGELPFFGFLNPRGSEDKVLCMSSTGETVLCDADKQSVDPIFLPPEDKGLSDTISFTVEGELEDDLYLIHSLNSKTCRFRVLRKEADGGWRWEPLPRPPFDYSPRLFKYSYTVVDRTIYVSSSGEEEDLALAPSGAKNLGTYSFDTVSGKWEHAGDWVLPFCGRVEYLPDLHLWLGLPRPSSSRSPTCRPGYNLCGTSELLQQPPQLHYVWQEDPIVPENWMLGSGRLVSLGSGRYCTALSFGVFRRVFRRGRKEYEGSDYEYDDDDWSNNDISSQFLGEVHVLSGVEVGRGSNRMPTVWKHKSVKFNISSCIYGVL